MAYYGKRSYRNNRRYNRKARKLSNKYIYLNRSAKSQANQIAALRNKVNKVYNACKPEIKTIVSSASTFNYTSSALDSYYKFYPMAVSLEGTEDKDHIGNYYKVINGVLYLSCEYFNSSSTGYHNTESSGCQVRVIIGQFNTANNFLDIPPISDIFEFPGNTGPNYTQLAISPLLEGITAKHKILKDLRFILTSERNQKMLKIPFKPKYPYIFSSDGKIRNCWACIVVSGLHYDSDFTETAKITVSDKVVYTDA